MSNLYEYIERVEPAAMDRQIGAIISRLFIPKAWRADARQQILLAWFETKYDQTRQHHEILAYAMNCAFFAASEWRRSVIPPVALPRAAEGDEPTSVPYDATYDDSGVVPANKSDHASTKTFLVDPAVKYVFEDELDEPELPCDEFTAHNLTLPKIHQPNSKITFEHLVVLFSEGLSVGEISAVCGASERTIYLRLSRLRRVNRYAV